jgi:D-alanine-D-alanine ligase
MAKRNRARHRCDIVLLVDEETGARSRDGGFVPDRSSMEEAVLKCLRARYREVAVVAFHPDIVPTVEALRRLDPQIVFNTTEWIDGDRTMDAAIAGILDMMKLAYTGTGPDGMRLARDKALSKDVVARLGIAVPRHFVIDPGDRVGSFGLPYPLIVKPRFGDGSDEINMRSLVKNDRELRHRVRVLRSRVDEPLVCEEFVPGRDLYVALLGNAPQVMQPVELVVGRKGAAAPQFATFRLKNDGAYRTRWRIRWHKKRMDAAAAREVNSASRRIFHALKLRDYGRIDYRLAPDGRLVFIEANPNPDLHPHAMGIDLCFAGVTYPEAVCRIVEAARRRARG